MKKIIFFTFALSLLFAPFVFAAGEGESRSFATIGTGGVTGIYYPVGGAIGRTVNARSDVYNVRVTVESTAGSVFNINAVLGGDLEFGVAQADRQYQAINGLAEWESAGAQPDLRSVFSLHGEAVTLVASVNSNIRSVSDLRDKKVNIGNTGSGQLQNSRDVLDAFGITENDIQAEFVKAADAPSLLQDGRIDAFFYTVGHPAGAISEATSGRVKVRFVPVAGSEITTMLEAIPYYAAVSVPASLYPQAVDSEKDVATIGMLATLVTSKSVSDDIVYAVTREVMENLGDFKKLHPALAPLSQETMLQGLSAPLHPGAIRYYEEVGINIPDRLRP